MEPIFLVEPSCPVSSHSLNWIFIQWAGGSKSLHDTYLLGSASYGTTGVALTGQYDITGTPYWLGKVPMAGTACASGVINFATPQNLDMTGTAYFTSEGNGAFKTVVGNATFFFNQYPIDPATELSSKSAPGITSTPSRPRTRETSSSLRTPLAIDGSGSLYIADSDNHVIRKVSAGVISTFAGSGVQGYGGDGGSALSADFNTPMGLAFAASGDLYIADGYNHA